MRLLQDFFHLFALCVIGTFGHLDRIKVIIYRDPLYLIYYTSGRKGHPADGTYLKIFMNRLSHVLFLLL